jgi:glycosyltransferase involved in cell wall biosynthesis
MARRRLDSGLRAADAAVAEAEAEPEAEPAPAPAAEAEPPPVPAAAPERPFRACLDKVSDGAAEGWIISRTDPFRHCVVVLREDGQVLGRAVASRFREDLRAAGIGDGCHAFAIPMPAALLDGEEHVLELVEEASGLALTDAPIRWRAAAGTADPAFAGPAAQPRTPPAAVPAAWRPTEAAAGTRLLFDISDLVYYIGHHANLTGIQRVQSSIVLAMLDAQLVAPAAVIFLSFDARTRNWVAVPTGFLASLLRDLFLPEPQRLVAFPAEEARYGILPGARPFDGAGVLDDGNPSVLCLLGAAWVNQDYMHRVVALKRRFGTRFVMTVHDLIPIYARDTCDQDTARVFEEFMRRALPHVDHVLAVSENTARDLRRYLAVLHLPEPAITVSRNGSSFAEFLPAAAAPSAAAAAALRDLPERFVLFVATIEGRKNHQLIFDLWRRMLADGDDPPHLVCVGRLGWRATSFISALVETNYLDGRVHLLRDVSDTDLALLYDRCLFTVCPTFYEGWGLPVGESLAHGRICVCSDRASVPEVAGECGVYIDIDDPAQALRVLRNLIDDDAGRRRLEAKIRAEYVPITWRSVAARVVAACEAATAVRWQEPYPWPTLPYATEISFGRLEQDSDGTGEMVLDRILAARQGHFLFDTLDAHRFLLGEQVRGAGAWAQPERWGTWLCLGGGEVAFSLAPDPSAHCYVFLRLRACGVLHDQPIRLFANGERAWQGRLGPQPRDVTLRVRKRAPAGRPFLLRIAVEAELGAETRAQVLTLDGRGPIVGFERLLVVPEDDVKTRLDVMTKSVM